MQLFNSKSKHDNSDKTLMVIYQYLHNEYPPLQGGIVAEAVRNHSSVKFRKDM